MSLRRQCLEHDSVDQIFEQLPEPIRESYEQAREPLDREGDDDPFATLTRTLIERQIELVYKIQFLGIYR